MFFKSEVPLLPEMKLEKRVGKEKYKKKIWVVSGACVSWKQLLSISWPLRKISVSLVVTWDFLPIFLMIPRKKAKKGRDTDSYIPSAWLDFGTYVSVCRIFFHNYYDTSVILNVLVYQCLQKATKQTSKRKGEGRSYVILHSSISLLYQNPKQPWMRHQRPL